jgi:hypothetical protein
MAVVNTKSTLITNADATPVVKSDAGLGGGLLHVAMATVEVAAADDNNSVYRFARLPSNARVVSMRVFCDAITAGTDYNVGLYQTAANGGAVVDDNCYADAVDLSSAITTGTEIAFEGRGIELIGQQVWADAGLSADSNTEYDVCATGITVGSAAGTISLAVAYTV